jgi:predicted metalloprotease with PDZ domain
VTYTLPARVVDGAIHYSGPSSYLYVVGRKEEKCRLVLETPADWKVACGLNEVRGKATEFTAPDYDVLADNPVSMGDLIVDTYTVGGKPHIIAMRNEAAKQMDRAELLKLCKHISESQMDFFGGLPYDKYVWHFAITNGRGGGGLEHLSSTQITMGSTLTPGSAGLCSHEYFHLWNVKRIRSKPLGPFDYTQLPKTGALWWLEGVTDYYADLLLLRYGWFNEEDFFTNLVQNFGAVRGNAARLEVSPNEASMRVGEAANGRGNSNGYRISYYNLGWVVGLCLDVELRARTNGRRSLDDVTRALWAMCKDGKPGFEEDEIRKQCVRFGGEAMGEFFDRVVMRPGELPVEEALAHAGLKVEQRTDRFVNNGIQWQPRGENRAPTITQVSGPATNLLRTGDVIVSIGGVKVDGPGSVNTELGKLKDGVEAKFVVMRDGQETEVSITPTLGSRTGWKVSLAELTNQAKKAFRESWYYAGKKKPSAL